MSRQLRIQFPGAIYHVTSRGDRRQAIVVDDVDRNTFFQRIGKTVEKYNWQMFATVLMTNHFHLFFCTPQANLSRGMQFLLGGYASWWNPRHGFTGHVFQGRFHGHIVEDETYYWSVSRYAHLNPTPVLVERPEQWPWSSYAGYVDSSRRLPWIDYDTLLNAWQGTFGGASPVEAYRQYVEAGLSEPVASPFEQATDGWILGSASFAERMRELLLPEVRRPSTKAQRLKVSVTREQIVQTVCNVCDVDPVVLSTRGSRHPARALVAYLCRCATDTTFAQIAEQLGLSGAGSVPTQIRRITQSLPSSELRQKLKLIEVALGLNPSSVV